MAKTLSLLGSMSQREVTIISPQPFLTQRTIISNTPPYIMNLILKSEQRPPFRFLDLPPELCKHIYAGIIAITYEIYSLDFCRAPTPAAGLTILTVSRSVYREARNILYQCGTFSFWVGVYSPFPP